MPQIQSIQVNINTLDVDGAGTDGSVYLGVCGREFKLDTTADDFEQGSGRQYVLGDGADVVNKGRNDPRKQLLLTEHIAAFPVYLRFAGDDDEDHWGLARAIMTLNNDLLPMWDTQAWIPEDEGIWLGADCGNIAFLPLHEDPKG